MLLELEDWEALCLQNLLNISDERNLDDVAVKLEKAMLASDD